MNIIVDANIIFSGILNTNGKVGDLLINSYQLIDFNVPDFLRTEIRLNKVQKTNFRFSEQVLEAILREAGE